MPEQEPKPEYVLTPEEIGVYTQTRLFNERFTPEAIRNLRKIQLFPAFLPPQVRDRFPDAGRVEQQNSRELILVDKNMENLMIAIPSSYSRLRRYEDMIERYIKEYMALPESGLAGSRLGLDVVHYQGAPRRTRIQFSNNAYDFSKRMLLENPDDKGSALKSQMMDIDAIVTGPLELIINAWFKGWENPAIKINEGNDDYLNYSVIQLGSKKVLCLDYLYGDQVGLLLSKVLREFASDVEGRNDGRRKIDIFLFGKVGSLDKRYDRHSIAVPNYLISEEAVRKRMEKSSIMHPVQNSLLLFDNNFDDTRFLEKYGLDDAIFGTNLAVNSVAKQRRDVLRRARSVYKCLTVEMELKDMLPVVETTENMPFLDVSLGFIGWVSDRPLVPADNLAVELESEEGARKALKILREKIMRG